MWRRWQGAPARPRLGALPAGARAAPGAALLSPAGRGAAPCPVVLELFSCGSFPKRPGPSASLPDPARPRRLHRMEEPLSSSWDRAWSPALWTRTRQRHSSTRRGPKPWAVGASLSPLTGSFSASPPLLSWHILGLPGRFRVAQSGASGRSPGEHAGVKGRGRCLQRAAAEPQGAGWGRGGFRPHWWAAGLRGARRAGAWWPLGDVFAVNGAAKCSCDQGDRPTRAGQDGASRCGRGDPLARRWGAACP